MPGSPPSATRNAAGRIRDTLAESGAALSVRDLVSATGFHENAVRRNLKELIRNGDVQVRRAPKRAGRGRPTLRYHLVPGREASHDEVLPLLLALLSDAGVGGEEAFRAGKLHGARSPRRADAHQAVVASLADLGFAPIEDPATDPGEDDAATIRLSRCPFAEIVQSPAASERLCAMHHGILAGVAEANGGRLAEFTIVNPRTGCCRARLASG